MYIIKKWTNKDNVYFYLDDNKLLVGLSINNISKKNKSIFKKSSI